MTIDFDQINQAALGALESLLVEWFPAGKRNGNEFQIGDISGNAGSSLSINLRSGVWCDFAGGDKGSDPISLLAAIRGCKQGEAAKELAERLSIGNLNAVAPLGANHKSRSTADDWEPMQYAPDDCAEPDLTHYKHGRPSAFWTYHTVEGYRVGVICRFDTIDGGKEVLPLTWCQHKSGSEGWRWKSFAKPRPLYRLPDIEARPDAWVLVVEGEKTAEAAQRLMPHCVVTTWAGGSKAVDLADFSHIENRKVIIWPDNDEAGIKAAHRIAGFIPKAIVVTPPADKPAGWDLADAEADGWTTDAVRAHIKGKPVEPLQLTIEPTPPPPEVHEAIEYAEQPQAEDAPEDRWPFRLLGHDDGTYYYLPDSSQQIVSLTAGEHKHLPFLRLAPTNWWEQTFPAKDGADWQAAANALIQRCHGAGIFTPRKIRGRGCWLDADSVLFHAGDRLIVSNTEHRIPSWDSKWIYEQGQRLESDQAEPLASSESARLMELTALMNWKSPILGKFLAGWVVIAPICGVLQWRPHIWITGSSGSGKTWCLNNIIDPLVGRLALQVQSATTEAGIRQTLRSDALPVIFDECESEDKKAQARIQSVLELARQASAESGAGIIKGSASGRAQEFQIRSCFAFASIGVAATAKADTSRVTLLELMRDNSPEGQARFERLKAVWAETVAHPEWSEGLRSRAFAHAKVISLNAKTFAKAVAVKLSDQRIGDQIGALIAGAFSLTSSKTLTIEEATKWVDAQNWSDFMPDEADKDETRAFSWLMDKQIRFEQGDRAYQRTISELLETYYSTDITVADSANIKANLIRFGIKVEEDTVTISNHHPALKTMFENTPWNDKWKDQFSRITGAVQLSSVRFGSSMHRGTRIPRSSFSSIDLI